MNNVSQTTELPLVALIGPTNAGKSTLFNRLTGSWQAVTAHEQSTTRDRVYGEVEWQATKFYLVDTGGLIETSRNLEGESDNTSEIYQSIKAQTLKAVEEADLILFVYDAREGVSPVDRQFLDTLRGRKEVMLVANKVDSLQVENTMEEPTYLGFQVEKVAATTGRGTGDLLETICSKLPKTVIEPSKIPIVAIIGRPNVGKSTLLNALTQSERAVVSPLAGTTRDVVTEKLVIEDKTLLLADTAGIRRRGKIGVGIENFSVKRALQAINAASAVLVLVDSTEGTTRGDLHLIYFAHQLKKPILVVFNKIDLIDNPEKVLFHSHLDKFERVSISAKESTNLSSLVNWLKKVEA